MRSPVLPALLALLLSGCAGYHIGPIQPSFMKGIQSISVPTFQNDTLYPRIEVLVADTVIKQIQQDGTYKIAGEDGGDAILKGTIRRIERRPYRSLVGNAFATSEFSLTVYIGFQMVKRDTGVTVDSREITGTTTFFVTSDVNQEERQALPLAVQDAATRLVTTISEGW